MKIEEIGFIFKNGWSKLFYKLVLMKIYKQFKSWNFFFVFLKDFTIQQNW